MTFAGAGNTNYTGYLLDLFCKIEIEYPENTRIALFNNWLVKTSGKPGAFCELDLMQEHHNFWLEELAKHKGKDFDNTWYWDVLSMHVHQFLRLKDEMEATVTLMKRGKKHTEPHLDNELLTVLRACREHQLHYFRRGRDLGFHRQDDFTSGLSLLGQEHRLDNHISKVLQEWNNMDEVLVADDDAPDASVYMVRPMTYDAHEGISVRSTEAYNQSRPQ